MKNEVIAKSRDGYSPACGVSPAAFTPAAPVKLMLSLRIKFYSSEPCLLPCLQYFAQRLDPNKQDA